MFWLPLLFTALSFAQEEVDLDAVRILESKLPERVESPVPDSTKRHPKNKYRSPYTVVSLDAIKASGLEHAHVKAGSYFIRLSDNKAVELTESFYGKFYKLQDDDGYKYVQGNDGTCVYKINTHFVNSVEPELALYEPPLRYTPAPVNIVRSDYDKRLKFRPEATFLVGVVQGNFMKDLFNDSKAQNGVSNQYGLHLASDWNLPIQVGLVVHYEKASYPLASGGNVFYTSPSFGPQFKTRDLDFFGEKLRFQAQFRVSPLAQVKAQTVRGNVDFKFNSSDLLFGAEYPVKNRFGEFVFGAYYQSQWLGLKEQPEIVSINSSNEINNSFGLSLAQVF